MTRSHPAEGLITDLTGRLCGLFRERASDAPVTYGFEYEFLSQEPMDRNRLSALCEQLPRWGFENRGGFFFNALGLGLAFEPGGQIEYHSPPLLPEDTETFYRLLTVIEDTNRAIGQETGIHYIGTGFMPGRGDAPLCLDSPRYAMLHERLSRTGTRGREMMKGTAAVHLHVVVRQVEKMVPIYLEMVHNMRQSQTFGMKTERRDIWDNTDPGRCGLPYRGITDRTDPRDFFHEFVRVAVEAEVLGRDLPFYQTEETEFEAFLYHLTTMFTDIRLNVKGPTLELRTPDSVPTAVFESMWEYFLRRMSTVAGHGS